ncbi:MAG: HupE/UreJ family protein [Armatimonadota bacterium]
MTLRNPRPGSLLVIAGLILCLFGPDGMRCLAHPGNIASAVAKVQSDGAFEVRLRFDLLAYALNELPNHIGDSEMNALLDGPPAELESRLSEAKERFRQGFTAGNGRGSLDTLTFPNAAEVLGSIKNVRSRLPVMASVTVSGHLPPGTEASAFRFDEGLGAVVLTTEFPYQEPVSEPVGAGAFSAEQRIPTKEAAAKAAAAISAQSGSSISPSPSPVASMPIPAPRPPRKLPAVSAPADKRLAPSPTATPPAPNAPVKAVTQLPISSGLPPHATVGTVARSPRPSPTVSPDAVPVTTMARTTPSQFSLPETSLERPPQTQAARSLKNFFGYVRMGFTHIVPEGVDHILFILGLFLLSIRIKPLVQQITAFTIAHSLTLALSLLGVIHVPPSVVEPIIAASIAFVAIENLLTTEIKPWRLAVVFGFGLIHGLGFAEALQSLGLNQNSLMAALVGFNVGVEIGQLTVVAAALILLGRFRNHRNFRSFVIVPGSLAIAAAAVFWTVQRVL